MKTQLIKLPEYNIIVSDESPFKTLSKWYYDPIDKSDYSFNYDDNYHDKYSEKYLSIIASGNPEHNLPSIDYSDLNEEEYKRIRHVNIIALSKASTKGKSFAHGLREQKVAEIYFRRGFKTAQEYSTLDKKELLIDYNKSVLKHRWDISKGMIERDIDNFLKQPKVFDIEVETEEYVLGSYGLSDGEPSLGERIKITNNSIKIIKVL